MIIFPPTLKMINHLKTVKQLTSTAVSTNAAAGTETRPHNISKISKAENDGETENY